MFCHLSHGAVDVIEELSITGTQIVQPGVPVRSLQKAVFGAFAIAGMPDLAVQTILWERIELGLAKLLLPTGIDEVFQRYDIQVPQEILGLHKVVATIDIAVVLHRQRAAACSAEDTERRFDVHPCAERLIEDLYEHAANVALNPFVKNIAQECAELSRKHAP